MVFTKKSKLYMGLILILAFCARIWRLIIDPVLARDSCTYLEIAKKWFQTGNYEYAIGEKVLPPLPFWLIKEAMYLCHDEEIAGRSISIFVGTLIPVVFFILAKELTNSNLCALIAGVIAGIHPNLIAVSVQPLRENSYLLLCGCAFVCLAAGMKKEQNITWFICGCFCALSILCRYEGAELIVITLFTLLLNLFSGVQKRKIIINGIVYVTGLSLCLTGTICAMDSRTIFLDKFANYKKYYHESSFQKINAIFFSENN